MNLQSLLNQNKTNYRNLLDFLEENTDEIYSQSINTFFDDLRIRNDIHDIRLFLKTLLKISNNHHRNPNFFNKVEQILVFLKNNIHEFSNSEIFNIFHSNKRILLFLIKEEMLTIDEHIFNKIMTTKKYVDAKFPQYFLPEIKQFLNESWISEFEYKFKGWRLIKELKIEIPETFEENRIKGENESYICQLIRNDSIIEFIKYVNQNNYSLKSRIKPSIYETNLFLIKQQIFVHKNDDKFIEESENLPTLIEYAAFYGSIQIFQYLRLNGVYIGTNIEFYAIHSNNPEFIHILEANHVQFNEYCFYESIKCHHNDIANYIKENYLNEGCENSYDFIYSVFENYNFVFIENNCFNQDCFYLLSRYDYYQFVKFLMNDERIDINRKYILKCEN
ncbi:hypothetical protein M9Y10_011204 [Tritrichomonas musculus]|uniref:DUF3447 domain-containing protein n=1 Tax=Tritrichomonas musculus TaxID=1915356 RepID=A0ABR2IK55_9EUKA